nr:MAG TPA: hypothetical protein [Caudoviricetes sp.]
MKTPYFCRAFFVEELTKVNRCSILLIKYLGGNKYG